MPPSTVCLPVGCDLISGLACSESAAVGQVCFLHHHIQRELELRKL